MKISSFLLNIFFMHHIVLSIAVCSNSSTTKTQLSLITYKLVSKFIIHKNKKINQVGLLIREFTYYVNVL